jgi:hypothetical protein
MLVLLVVMPCLVVGAAVVVVLDRMGVLSLGGGMSSPGDGSFLERVPKSALFAAMVLLAAWILAWLVLLVVGLNVLAS